MLRNDRMKKDEGMGRKYGSVNYNVSYTTTTRYVATHLRTRTVLMLSGRPVASERGKQSTARVGHDIGHGGDVVGKVRSMHVPSRDA